MSGERPRQAKRFAVVPVSAALDPRLGNLALRVLILLASYADSKTRECYPQQATMAAQLGLAVSKTTGAGALSRAIGKLVEFGYVEKLTRRSKGWVYRVASDLPLDGKSLGVGDLPPDGKSPPVAEQGDLPLEGKGDLPPGGKGDLPYCGKSIRTYHLTHHLTEESKTLSDPFDEFWKHYPRRVEKPRARAAFVKARSKVPANEIIAGAMRYAAERDGENPKYTKHPATWLNSECWSDEPCPKARPNGKTTATHGNDRANRTGFQPDQAQRRRALADAADQVLAGSRRIPGKDPG